MPSRSLRVTTCGKNAFVAKPLNKFSVVRWRATRSEALQAFRDGCSAILKGLLFLWRRDLRL